MKRFALLALLALACAGDATAWAASARVDRDRITESETLELRIRVDGTGDAEPELAPLAQDFEVLSSSRNARIAMINGRGESFAEWVYTLAPRRSGELQIPALEVGSERTQALRVVVSADDAGAQAAPGTQDVVLEIVPDSREVHVQQQVLLTVRLLHAVDLANGATLDEPAIDGAVVRKIGEGSYQKRIGARQYGVFERRYAIFPQASGELVVPRLRFDATVGGGSWFDRFGGAGKHLRLRSSEQRIHVAPPEQGTNPWLPARLLTLVETWDRSPDELEVGESATRTLTLAAEGLTAAQLPALPGAASEGLRLYPDKPGLDDATGQDGITGTRTERSAVIPLRAGELQLPEIRLRWWDTVNARFEEAVVPGRTIRVQAAAGSMPPGTTAAPAGDAAVSATADADLPQSGTPALAPASGALRAWQAACALLALLSAFSLWQWRRALRRAPGAAEEATTGDEDEARRFAALRGACRRNDAAAVPGLLLGWARAALPQRTPCTLAELPARLAAPELRESINGLQASRYSAAGAPWDGAVLLGQVEALRSRLAGTATRRASLALPPLYPERDGLSG